MNRPARITIFGILCLVVGLVSGIKNLTEAGLSIAGPGGVEQLLEMNQNQGRTLSEMQAENFELQIAVLKQRTYRVVQGVESSAAALMAGLLMIAGVGLLFSQRWSIRLARAWAYFALVSAVVSTVLNVVYVLPQTPDAAGQPGIGLVTAFVMLPLLWAFPVLILTLLSRPPVMAYLQAKQKAAAGAYAQAPASTPPQPQPPPRSPSDPPAELPPPAPRPAPPEATPASQTWRDDPWNDPHAR